MKPLHYPSQNESYDDVRRAPAAGEVVIGVFVEMDEEGRTMVDHPANPRATPVVALSTVSLTRTQIGRTVALLFSEGDIDRPVIVGLVHNPLDSVLERTGQPGSQGSYPDDASEESKLVKVDGRSVAIEGSKEVVLKCGDASITLTRAGKILIRGTYLLNRSTGVNRILGGSVQVN